MPWRMRYYLSNVLAMFYNQSEKYSIQTDEFEGTVRIRDSYLRSKGNTRDETYLNVEFGFRACRHGEWAIAAYGPDLDKASVDEKQLWSSFEIVGAGMFTDPADDPRFQKWVDRPLMEDWKVEIGQMPRLVPVLRHLTEFANFLLTAPCLRLRTSAG